MLPQASRKRLPDRGRRQRAAAPYAVRCSHIKPYTGTLLSLLSPTAQHLSLSLSLSLLSLSCARPSYLAPTPHIPCPPSTNTRFPWLALSPRPRANRPCPKALALHERSLPVNPAGCGASSARRNDTTHRARRRGASRHLSALALLPHASLLLGRLLSARRRALFRVRGGAVVGATVDELRGVKHEEAARAGR